MAAVRHLTPELIANPRDPGICDMVAGMLATAPLDADQGGGYDDPLVNRANNAWRLLQVVAASAQARAEGGH
jgi:hypothetical protein